MTEQIKKQEERVKTCNDMLQKAQGKYDDNDTHVQKWKQAVFDANTELNNLKTSLEQLPSPLKLVGDALEESGEKITKIGDGVSKTGETLTKKVTAPIVAGFGAAVKETAGFDQSMSQVAAISGATGADFDALRAKAREMGSTTQFSASDAADAFTYMAMAGWKTEDMLSGISGIMNLSAASGEDLATTSDIVTDALTAFGLSADDSAHFADIMASASSNANTNVAMLGESFKYVAPVSGALGISAEDTAVALGLMANSGIKASSAGTAMRSGLTNLAKPTKDMVGYMTKYGIELKENEDGSINLQATMEDMREKLGGLTEAEQAEVASAIFGKEAMSGWLAIINASDSDFEKLTGAIENCDGTAANMAATMQDNLAGDINKVKSAISEFAISIGDILMPKIRAVVSKIQGFIEKLNGLSDSEKEQIVKIAAVVAAIGPALVVVGKVVSTVGRVTTAVGKAIGFIDKIGPALSGISAPVAIAVAVIAVLVGAFVTLWNNNEEFRNKMISIWEEVKGAFQEFGDAIVERLNALGFSFEDITEVISTVWNGFCDVLAPVFEGVWQQISNVIQAALDIIIGIVDVFIGIFNGDWEQVWNGAQEIISACWGLIQDTIDNILNVIKGLVDVFLGWFGTDWDTVWNTAKTTVTNIINTIKTTISTVLGNIKTFISTTLTTIKNKFSTIWEAIKSKVTEVVEAVRSAVDEKITAVKTTVNEILTKVKNKFTSIWDAVQTKVEEVVEAVKSAVEEKIESVRTAIKEKLDKVKSKFTEVWDAAQSKVEEVVTAIKTAVEKPMETIKGLITGPLDTIKSTFDSVWGAAESAVTTAIDNIKNALNFTWSLPALKLPHITVSGSFSLDPPSVPKFGISWYRKAMDNGMILTHPTIFGMQNGQFLGGGEAGPEVVAGADSLYRMIAGAVAAGANARAVSNSTTYGDTTINVYGAEGQDVRQLAREVGNVLLGDYRRAQVVWS